MTSESRKISAALVEAGAQALLAYDPSLQEYRTPLWYRRAAAAVLGAARLNMQTAHNEKDIREYMKNGISEEAAIQLLNEQTADPRMTHIYDANGDKIRTLKDYESYYFSFPYDHELGWLKGVPLCACGESVEDCDETCYEYSQLT